MKRDVFSNPGLEVDLEGVVKKEESDSDLKGRAHEVLTYLCYAFSLENMDLEGSFPFFQFCANPRIQDVKGKPMLVHTPDIMDIAFVKEDGSLFAVADAKDYRLVTSKKVIESFNQMDRYARDLDIERILVFSHLHKGDYKLLEKILDEYREYGNKGVSYCVLEDLEFCFAEKGGREIYRRIKNNVSILKGNVLKIFLEMVEYAIADLMINTRDMRESWAKIEKGGYEFDMRENCVINFGGRYSIELRVVRKD